MTLVSNAVFKCDARFTMTRFRASSLSGVIYYSFDFKENSILIIRARNSCNVICPLFVFGNVSREISATCHGINTIPDGAKGSKAWLSFQKSASLDHDRVSDLMTVDTIPLYSLDSKDYLIDSNHPPLVVEFE